MTADRRRIRMKPINEMKVTFPSRSANEGFARAVVASFLSQLDPAVDELSDLRTAVSEAVTNAILHGYEGKGGTVRLSAELYEGGRAVLEVVDCGVGIEDVERAREPLYTSRPDMERSGMGFTVMETFMDAVSVRSRLGHGTTVRMEKQLGCGAMPEKAP